MVYVRRLIAGAGSAEPALFDSRVRYWTSQHSRLAERFRSTGSLSEIVLQPRQHRFPMGTKGDKHGPEGICRAGIPRIEQENTVILDLHAPYCTPGNSLQSPKDDPFHPIWPHSIGCLQQRPRKRRNEKEIDDRCPEESVGDPKHGQRYGDQSEHEYCQNRPIVPNGPVVPFQQGRFFFNQRTVITCDSACCAHNFYCNSARPNRLRRSGPGTAITNRTDLCGSACPPRFPS